MTAPSLSDDLALALALAADADLISLDRYRAQDLDVTLKADRTHLTDADTRVERLVRDALEASRPDDAVLGEEFGGERVAGRQWIVDPIDGTTNFVRGVPIWGLLLALAVDGVPVLSVVSAPALGKRWWAAEGLGAWALETRAPRGGEAHAEEPRRIHVSDVAELGDATLSYNSLKGWDEAGRLDGLLRLGRAVTRTRAFGDLWSYMLVAEGAVDVAGEFDLRPWDIAALAPIVREAGGRLTSVDGVESVWEGSALASNGLLHDAALAQVALH